MSYLPDFARHIHRQRAFSLKTFGPDARPLGIIAHIEQELDEIRRDPADLKEWIDVIILAIDGATRQGHQPEAIAAALVNKQKENERRKWPDWKTFGTDQPIGHIKAEE